ncbi:MAG: type II toxin-antitoxin system RelE/ParE family toxin [Victivallales bacterium]|jgi:mRNA interferase RelE/StbE
MPRQERGALSEYRIFETDELIKSLGKLPDEDASFLRNKLSSHVYPQLRKVPFYGPNIKKLRAYSPETWRYRIGKYRVFFQIDSSDRIVFILTVEKRKDAYR